MKKDKQIVSMHFIEGQNWFEIRTTIKKYLKVKMRGIHKKAESFPPFYYFLCDLIFVNSIISSLSTSDIWLK